MRKFILAAFALALIAGGIRAADVTNPFGGPGISWDAANKLLQLNQQPTVTPIAAETGTQLQFTGLDGFATTFFTDSFGATSAWDCRFTSGTFAAKTATATGATMCQWNVQGWDGSAYAKSGRLRWLADPSGATWSGSDHGTKLVFLATPPGSITTATVATLDGNGNLATTGRVSSSSIGLMRVVITGVNFNSANTDNPVAIATLLPTGITRYSVNRIQLANASASISTATVGVFTAAAAGGATIAANQAITVTATAADTVNNYQSLTLTNATTIFYTTATIQLRVGTAQGSAATADVVFEIMPLT